MGESKEVNLNYEPRILTIIYDEIDKHKLNIRDVIRLMQALATRSELSTISVGKEGDICKIISEVMKTSNIKSKRWNNAIAVTAAVVGAGVVGYGGYWYGSSKCCSKASSKLTTPSAPDMDN